MKEKALDIAASLKLENFKASTGWLAGFKKRFGIKAKAICGESGAVNKETVNHWLENTLQDIIKDYSLDCIYNVDETALYYNLLPSRTLAEKSDDCHDGKRSKERVTVLLGTNADGSDKLKPLIIGKSQNPRCFKNVHSFPTDYSANRKAWMTGARFEKFVQDLDKRMRKMKKKILFVDNCPAHPKDIKCTNIKLVFFPPNCTSLLQPCDLGIIENCKVRYRKRRVKRALQDIENKRINNADSGPSKINILGVS